MLRINMEEETATVVDDEEEIVVESEHVSDNLDVHPEEQCANATASEIADRGTGNASQENGGGQSSAQETAATIIYQHKQPKIDWENPEVQQILRDYKEKGHGSTRQIASQIAKITGVLVSHSTISRQCRPKSSRPRRYANQYTARNKNRPPVPRGVGIAAYQNHNADESESNGEEASDSMGLNRTGRRDLFETVKFGRNGPVRKTGSTPYYMSFSERFKQTSLTVHLSPDEVRIYRHTSHSRSGRAIYFRCSRCDGINRKLRTGITPRIKMYDGVVVGDLYPEHHPRCKPMSVVAARVREIERRCRKDIINGMDPKEAWNKGRMAAISESASVGTAVYGPGSLIAAFPDWEKCKRLYCTLRGKVLRRRMQSSFYDPRRYPLPERDEYTPATHAPRNGVDEISRYDVSEPPRRKQPRMVHSVVEDAYEGNAYALVAGNDVYIDEDYEELEDLDFEEALFGDGIDFGNVASEEVVTTQDNQSFSKNFMRSETGFSRSSSLSFSQNRNGNYPLLDSGYHNDSPSHRSGSQGISESSADVYDEELELEERLRLAGSNEQSAPAPFRPLRKQTTHYEETEQLPEERSDAEESPAFSASGRPKRKIRRSRKLSPLPRPMASQINSGSFRQTHSGSKKEKNAKSSKVEPFLRRNDLYGDADYFVTILTPAGFTPTTARRRAEKFNKQEALEKLRQIEKNIAEYNAYSDNKIASVLVRSCGQIKVCGSKLVIDAFINPYSCQALKNLASAQQRFQNDELIAFPLLKCRDESEIDAIHDAKIKPMLNEFISAVHYPGVHSFDTRRPPDYWPNNIPYCDSTKDATVFKNDAGKPEYRVLNSVADGEREILKYASRHYTEFLRDNFGVNFLAGFENVVNTDDGNEYRIEGESLGNSEGVVDSHEFLTSFEFEGGVDEGIATEGTISLRFGDDFENASSNLSGPGRPESNAAALNSDLLTGTSNQRTGPIVRYDGMMTDCKTITDRIRNIQHLSSCRVVAVFADEKCNLILSGDKTLISAVILSDINRCLSLLARRNLDKEVETLPLLRTYDDAIIDRLTENYAMELLDDMMEHISFPWTDPYEGERPEYWPPEIPFCPPRSDNGQSILNRRIGVNSPGQAAKIVLKSIHWFHTEKVLNEKLKMDQPLPSAKNPPSALLGRNHSNTEKSAAKLNSSGYKSSSRPGQCGSFSDNSPGSPHSSQASKVNVPAKKHFLKVFCRCRERGEITSRDCRFCDRCVRYFHDRCLPLKEVDRFFLCIKCAPLQ